MAVREKVFPSECAGTPERVVGASPTMDSACRCPVAQESVIAPTTNRLAKQGHLRDNQVLSARCAVKSIGAKFTPRIAVEMRCLGFQAAGSATARAYEARLRANKGAQPLTRRRE